MRWTMGLACTLLTTAPLGAQQRTADELNLPRTVAEEVIGFFNSPSTIRFQGRADIPEGRSVIGDVAVLNGPVIVAGEIQGDLVVVNGTLTMHAGGRVTGDVTVLGGHANVDSTTVGGRLTVYDEPLTYKRVGDRITYDDSPWSRWGERRRQGRSYLLIHSASNYNRVEGFPVMFGPVFRTLGDQSFRAEALAIWKSESGIRLAARELGYSLRAEQRFGNDGQFAAGVSAHSLVAPIESNGLLDIEASLASFLLHRDYRDYVQKEGFSVFARYGDESQGHLFEIEYQDDTHSFVPVGSPWTLKHNDAPWRSQPLVAEGRFRSISGRIQIDRRNDRDDPTDGWYVEARATAGLGGNLTLPGYRLAAPDPPTMVQIARAVPSDLTTGSVDLRRYARLGPGADLRLRGYVAGSLGGGTLPPQFQRTLGGEGNMPGFPVMSIDCGARASSYTVFRTLNDSEERMPVFAGYGCDRVALFQAEYRSNLPFDFGFGPGGRWHDRWDWHPGIDFTPSWSVFFDAGRGWTLADPGSPALLGADTETLMDAGFGLRFGDLGLYWAWPLNGANRNANFFLRIDHRF